MSVKVISSWRVGCCKIEKEVLSNKYDQAYASNIQRSFQHLLWPAVLADWRNNKYKTFFKNKYWWPRNSCKHNTVWNTRGNANGYTFLARIFLNNVSTLPRKGYIYETRSESTRLDAGKSSSIQRGASLVWHFMWYEREPVKRSQMDINVKHVIFEPGKNIYFLTYPPSTLVHMPHRFTSASKPATQKSFDCYLSHFRTSVSNSSSSAKNLPASCEPPYETNTSQLNRKHFFMNYLCIESLWRQKIRTAERCSSVVYRSNTVANLTTEISL
jgi:hypothetical protein